MEFKRFGLSFIRFRLNQFFVSFEAVVKFKFQTCTGYIHGNDRAHVIQPDHKST